jgi:hypothetical protein
MSCDWFVRDSWQCVVERCLNSARPKSACQPMVRLEIQVAEASVTSEAPLLRSRPYASFH